MASLIGDDPLIRSVSPDLPRILDANLAADDGRAVSHPRQAWNGASSPPGFVASVLPKVNKLLMTSTEGEVLRPGAEAVEYMLMHDHHQVFAWHDAESNCSDLRFFRRIIDRLLGPSN